MGDESEVTEILSQPADYTVCPKCGSENIEEYPSITEN
jgi:predicted nucleic-acid-binding Zn-ribbon protein